MRQDIGRTNQELKMSINGLNLTAEQLKMNIGWNGTSYLFKSPEIDNRGEKTGNYIEHCTIYGIMHRTKGYTTKNTSDGTTIKAKDDPMLLFVSTDKRNTEMPKDYDKMVYFGKEYIVHDVAPIIDGSEIWDISLYPIE